MASHMVGEVNIIVVTREYRIDLLLRAYLRQRQQQLDSHREKGVSVIWIGPHRPSSQVCVDIQLECSMIANPCVGLGPTSWLSASKIWYIFFPSRFLSFVDGLRSHSDTTLEEVNNRIIAKTSSTIHARWKHKRLSFCSPSYGFWYSSQDVRTSSKAKSCMCCQNLNWIVTDAKI